MIVRATPRPGIARCAYCHDQCLKAVHCGGCGTRLHERCLSALRECPTLGCRYARPLTLVPTRLKVIRSSPLEGWWTPPWRLLLALAGFVFLSCVVTVNVVAQMETSRRTKVQADMLSIHRAIDMFRITTGRDPKCLHELWIAPSDVAERWNGPYLEECPPKDPWGNDYLLSKGPFLVSLGADGQVGGVEAAADLDSRTIRLPCDSD